MQIAFRSIIKAIFLLCMGIAPCYAMSEDEILDETVVKLEQIEMVNGLAAAFDQMFFRAYGEDHRIPPLVPGWFPDSKPILKSALGDVPRRYQDGDLRRFLTEYEQLQRRYVAALEGYPPKHKEKIRKNLSWWYTLQKQSEFENLLGDPITRSWWYDNLEFLRGAGRLNSLAQLVLKIAPDRFLNSETIVVKGIIPTDTHLPYDSQFFVKKHSQVDALIHSNILLNVLPAEFDLKALRELDLKIHAQTLRMQYRQWEAMSGLDGAVSTLRDGVLWFAASRESADLQADAVTVIPTKLKEMAARLRLAQAR